MQLHKNVSIILLRNKSFFNFSHIQSSSSTIDSRRQYKPEPQNLSNDSIMPVHKRMKTNTKNTVLPISSLLFSEGRSSRQDDVLGMYNSQSRVIPSPSFPFFNSSKGPGHSLTLGHVLIEPSHRKRGWKQFLFDSRTWPSITSKRG